MTKQKAYSLKQALGIGDAMVDLFTHASQLPPKGGNIWSTAVKISPGGTTANVSANLAKLGIPSSFVGCLGDDPYGHYCVDELKKVGVDTSGIEIHSGAYTGIVLAIIDDDGERTFICCGKGAAHTLLSVQTIEKIRFVDNQVVHSSGVCLVEEPARTGLLRALRLAVEKGNEVYFDPNLRLEGNIFPEELRKAQWLAISLSDVVLIGDEELRVLCENRSCREGAELILRAGAKLVVVKQGEKGASVFSDQSEEHVAAFKVKVNSTAGAGDSFDAGFIAARLREANLHDALVYANAVAAIKVTKLGSRSIPDHEEVIAFIQREGQAIKLSS